MKRIVRGVCGLLSAVMLLSTTAMAADYTPVVTSDERVKGFYNVYNGENASLQMELAGRYNSGAMNADGGSLEIVLSDPQVESVLVNVYGGITSCEQVAKGILEALDKLGSSKPLVVRFDGNAAAEGLRILAQANRVNLHVAQTMEEAAQQAARLAANGKEVR